ncbi:hypothetical protein ACPPVO_00455 [Dactylosporangium sp. McL0621]|uniref:hypothetical protein n=1 Tax=Dactylosporangium sp. McL0621 TaxID=3415678 RepID=UPI003CED0E12
MPAVALLGRALRPLNAGFYLRYINFDPQSDAELLDQRHADAAALATSGLGAAQLVALLLGAALVARGRPSPARTVARMAAAAVAGLVLAAADLAAVLPGQHRVPWAPVVCGALLVAVSGALGAALAGASRWPWIGPALFAPLPGCPTYLMIMTNPLVALALWAAPAVLFGLAALVRTGRAPTTMSR